MTHLVISHRLTTRSMSTSLLHTGGDTGEESLLCQHLSHLHSRHSIPLPLPPLPLSLLSPTFTFLSHSVHPYRPYLVRGGDGRKVRRGGEGRREERGGGEVHS